MVCLLSYLTTYHISSILCTEVWVLVLLSISVVIFSSCIILICKQPQTCKKVSFMVRAAQVVVRSSALQNETLMCAFFLIAGSPSAFSAHSEHFCQYLPHVSAEWRYMDSFLCVDGCWWVSLSVGLIVKFPHWGMKNVIKHYKLQWLTVYKIDLTVILWKRSNWPMYLSCH